MMDTIRFQDALPIAIEFTKQHYGDLSNHPPIIIRDLYGKIRLFLHGDQNEPHQALAIKLAAQLGQFAYAADAIFIYEADFFNSKSITESPDKIHISETTPPIYLLDKQITGQDWLRSPIKENPHPPRVTLFGIKGGVGRSTALAIWAWHLAKRGKKVLVIDLDLESPGIGQILLPQNRFPDFGVVDWLVEQAVGQTVGQADNELLREMVATSPQTDQELLRDMVATSPQADQELLRDMVATSPLAESCEGVIKVVPAAGGIEQDYIAKLSRVYMDINQAGKSLDFAHRLALMLQQLEAQEEPDIVLLDSRAGIHDIAAIAITRLTDMAFLFAVNTPQTWLAYRYLFSHWQKWNINLSTFRDNLKIVAAMIPELGREDYMSRCRESAYNLFLETIYEDTTAEEIDKFNFALDDISAPHFPAEILWNISFQEFNPESEDYFLINGDQLNACYGNFLKTVTQLVLGE